MSRLRHLLTLLPLLASGCALQPYPPGEGAPVYEGNPDFADIEGLRTQARLLRYRGRHSEALAHLDRALKLRPNNKELREERDQAALAWNLRKQELEDRLLVSSTHSSKEQLPILQELVRANPDDDNLRADLDRLRDSQLQVDSRLTACGRRQADRKRELARMCLRLALDIKEDPEARSLLARLDNMSTPHPGERQAPTSQASLADGKTPQELSPELIKARELIRLGNTYGAIRHLNKLEERGEATPYSRALLQQAKDALARDTLAMLQTGDLLFSEGKPREALALWEAVLNMDPYNDEARHKSELAMREISSKRPGPQTGH